VRAAGGRARRCSHCDRGHAGLVTMRILIAPDKFKGSLPAVRVAAAVAAGLSAAASAGMQLTTMPVADGGDGTVDAAVAAGFRRVPVVAAGPTDPPGRTSYARRPAPPPSRSGPATPAGVTWP